MAIMLIRHKVKDFAAWKSMYDEFEYTRKDSGVKAAGIHRDPDDPNVVIVMHQFDDIDTAFAYGESEDLRKGMEQAGLIGEPEIWYGEDVEFSLY